MNEASDSKRVWFGIIVVAIIILVAGWLYARYTQETSSHPTLIPVSKEEREHNRVHPPSPPLTPH